VALASIPTRQGGIFKQLQQLTAGKLASQHRLALCIDAVNLEDRLGQILPDNRYLLHLRFFSDLSAENIPREGEPSTTSIADVRALDQHAAMNARDYLLPEATDAADLSPWFSILPRDARILRTNLFGDVFLVGGEGAVYMLERAGCAVSKIAPSEEHFWQYLDDDEEGWQLRPLADACRREGKSLQDGQCYAFTVLPFLGGDYTVENIWVAPWQEWFALTADLFRQTRDLQDGQTVVLKVAD
jgi:hypothetical protein